MSSPFILPPRRRVGAITGAAFVLALTLTSIRSAVSSVQNTSAAPVIEETFVLKHLKPSALVSFLAQNDKVTPLAKPGVKPDSYPALLPASIKSVTPDDVFNTVTIQGAPDAIATIRKLAVLLDVAPPPVRLTIRIIRYRTAAAQKAGGTGLTPLADVAEVASGIVETPSNSPVEVTTFGDRHTFRARLIPHANNTASVTIAADLQIAASDGTFGIFPVVPSGTRRLRIGDRGLITSVGAGVSAVSVHPEAADPKAAKLPEQAAPETYYLEVTPSFPPVATEKPADKPVDPPAAKP